MNRSWKHSLLALPGIGVSLLPKLLCPACWPAYAGLLSSIGLGFLISTTYLLPLTVAFLALALAALAFRAGKRRGYGPFIIGVVATAAVLLGKFGWNLRPLTYAGDGILVIGLFWNAWPHRPSKLACPACMDNQSQ